LWGLALHFSPEREAAQLAAALPPLPMTLAAGGPRPFVILAYQRTGSNLLCGRLHNHARVVMHNELFNVAKIWTYQNEDVRADPTWKWDLFSRDADPCGFLADVYSRPSLTKPHACAVGLKLFPDHWTSSNQLAMRQLLADPRVAKVILRRPNVLRVYVSKLRADKTGLYLCRSLDGVRVHVEPAALAAFAEHYKQVYDFYDACVTGQSVHRVSYDELASPATADGAVRGVLRFLLGVDCDKPPPPLAVTVRQSAAPLRQGVTNYEQLREAFKHHPLLRRCFEEEETDGEELF
jgi:LPS sulfotransferase NodH